MAVWIGTAELDQSSLKTFYKCGINDDKINKSKLGDFRFQLDWMLGFYGNTTVLKGIGIGIASDIFGAAL